MSEHQQRLADLKASSKKSLWAVEKAIFIGGISFITAMLRNNT